MTHLSDEQDRVLHCRIAADDVNLFNMLLEGYDNLLLVTAAGKESGEMTLHYAAASEKEVLSVLKTLPLPLQLSKEGSSAPAVPPEA